MRKDGSGDSQVARQRTTVHCHQIDARGGDLLARQFDALLLTGRLRVRLSWFPAGCGVLPDLYGASHGRQPDSFADRLRQSGHEARRRNTNGKRDDHERRTADHGILKACRHTNPWPVTWLRGTAWSSASERKRRSLGSATAITHSFAAT